MLKQFGTRLGFIVAAIASASVFMLALPTALTAWAAEAPKITYMCNAGTGAQCGFVNVAPMTNTTLSMTTIATSALPVTVTIRITTALPVPVFDNTFGANYAIGNAAYTQAVLITETNRIALISVPIPTTAPGQTQTKILISVFPPLSNPENIEGNFIINHLAAPISPTVPPTYYTQLPIVAKTHCAVKNEFCFGANDTFTDVVSSEVLPLNQTIAGSVAIPNDQRDFYRMTIADARPHTITLNATGPTIPNGDLDLYLYNAQQQIICRSSFIGNSYEQIRINVLPCSSSPAFTTTQILPGTYTLLVRYGFSEPALASTVPYTLSISP